MIDIGYEKIHLLIQIEILEDFFSYSGSMLSSTRIYPLYGCSVWLIRFGATDYDGHSIDYHDRKPGCPKISYTRWWIYQVLQLDRPYCLSYLCITYLTNSFTYITTFLPMTISI